MSWNQTNHFSSEVLEEFMVEETAGVFSFTGEKELNSLWTEVEEMSSALSQRRHGVSCAFFRLWYSVLLFKEYQRKLTWLEALHFSWCRCMCEWHMEKAHTLSWQSSGGSALLPGVSVGLATLLSPMAQQWGPGPNSTLVGLVGLLEPGLLFHSYHFLCLYLFSKCLFLVEIDL